MAKVATLSVSIEIRRCYQAGCPLTIEHTFTGLNLQSIYKYIWCTSKLGLLFNITVLVNNGLNLSYN